MSDKLVDKYSEEVTDHMSSLSNKNYVVVDNENKLWVSSIFHSVEAAKRYISANVNYYNSLLETDAFPINREEILEQLKCYQDLHIKRIKILED